MTACSWRVVGRDNERAHGASGFWCRNDADTHRVVSGRRTTVFSSPPLETAKENTCPKWHLALIAPSGVVQIRGNLCSC